MNRFTAAGARRAAAILGFLGVALGAFGAHALSGRLTAQQTMALWEKAVFYHLLHAGVLLVVTGWRPWPRGAWLFLVAGIVAFSGSLYLYALTKIFWLVFVTPFGGVFLLVGWLLLAWRRTEEKVPDPELP